MNEWKGQRIAVLPEEDTNAQMSEEQRRILMECFRMKYGPETIFTHAHPYSRSK